MLTLKAGSQRAPPSRVMKPTAWLPWLIQLSIEPAPARFIPSPIASPVVELRRTRGEENAARARAAGGLLLVLLPHAAAATMSSWMQHDILCRRRIPGPPTGWAAGDTTNKRGWSPSFSRLLSYCTFHVSLGEGNTPNLYYYKPDPHFFTNLDLTC